MTYAALREDARSLTRPDPANVWINETHAIFRLVLATDSDAAQALLDVEQVVHVEVEVSLHPERQLPEPRQLVDDAASNDVLGLYCKHELLEIVRIRDDRRHRGTRVAQPLQRLESMQVRAAGDGCSKGAVQTQALEAGAVGERGRSPTSAPPTAILPGAEIRQQQRPHARQARRQPGAVTSLQAERLVSGHRQPRSSQHS